jgi:hypothetical protein
MPKYDWLRTPLNVKIQQEFEGKQVVDVGIIAEMVFIKYYELLECGKIPIEAVSDLPLRTFRVLRSQATIEDDRCKSYSINVSIPILFGMLGLKSPMESL